MIQLCVKEDFPQSRTGLARLKGPKAQTQSFLYLYKRTLQLSETVLWAGEQLDLTS